MKKISIIIPFYNRVEWAKEAIGSVLAQTYQDFEIIIVDDGSDNDYKTELESLDKRIRYLRQVNKGPSSARNMGMKSASGYFIAFLDSDDLFLERKLEIQMGVMDDHPDVMFSHTSYYQVNDQGKQLNAIKSGQFTGNVYPGILAFCPIATPTVMLRREVVEGLEFNERIRVAEDILLWSQISKKNLIIGIDIPLTNVRMHGKNAAIDLDKQLEGLSNIIKYGLDADSSISKHDRNKVLHDIYRHIGYIHIKQKRYIHGFINLTLAFKSGLSYKRFSEKLQFLWPLAHSLSYKIAKKIIPGPIRKYLKDIAMSLFKPS